MRPRCNPIFRELVIRDSLWPNRPAARSKVARFTMTPTPDPPQPEGENPLPPRHRPNLNELGQSTTESELWSLDEDLDTDGPAPDEPLRAQGGVIPEPRQRKLSGKPGASSRESGENPPAEREQVRMDVGKSRSVPSDEKNRSAMSSSYADLDDLEMWDDEPDDIGIGELPPVSEVPPAPVAGGPKPSVTPPDEIPVTEKETPAMEPEETFSLPPRKSAATPVASLRPRLGLSGFERIGMIALGALLLAGAVYFYVFSVKRLPTETLRAETTDFPIEGERVSVESADTYWRVPVTEGPEADTVRRGTRLMPEIEMKANGHGAVRVLFRDDERQFVGDAVTRQVDGSATLRIPATAGFEDTGMHAAYRTGGTKPWTAAVYEGESVSSPGSGFKLLFEMNISTNRR